MLTRARLLAACALVAACSTVGCSPGAAGKTVADGDAGTAAPDAAVAEILDAAQDGGPSATDTLADDSDVATVSPDAPGTDATAVDAGADALLDAIPDTLPDVLPDVADSTDAGPDTAPKPDVAIDGATDATPACDDKPPVPVSQADTMCKPACPLPYPCYCGTCPWLKTEPMLYPRWGHAAVWTGKEVLVFGYLYDTSNTGMISGEKWSGVTGEPWQPVNTPSEPWSNKGPYGMQVYWTGKKAVVYPGGTSPKFLYDPQTDKYTLLPPINQETGVDENVVFAGGKVFHNHKNKLDVYDPETNTATTEPYPFELMPAGTTYAQAFCIASSGDDLFLYHVYAVGGGAAPWPNGLDATNGFSLRLHVPSMTWSVLPPAPTGLPTCYAEDHVTAGFPHGFIVWSLPFKAEQFYGVIYRHDTKTWTVMSKIGQPGGSYGIHAIWAGGRFAIATTVYAPGFPLADLPKYGGFHWPILFDPYANEWSQLTKYGAVPDDRTSIAMVYTGTELMELGGSNGGKFAALIHADGRRIALDPTNTAAP